jgi:hypothetical protein
MTPRRGWFHAAEVTVSRQIPRRFGKPFLAKTMIEVNHFNLTDQETIRRGAASRLEAEC